MLHPLIIASIDRARARGAQPEEVLAGLRSVVGGHAEHILDVYSRIHGPDGLPRAQSNPGERR